MKSRGATPCLRQHTQWPKAQLTSIHVLKSRSRFVCFICNRLFKMVLHYEVPPCQQCVLCDEVLRLNKSGHRQKLTKITQASFKKIYITHYYYNILLYLISSLLYKGKMINNQTRLDSFNFSNLFPGFPCISSQLNQFPSLVEFGHVVFKYECSSENPLQMDRQKTRDV